MIKDVSAFDSMWNDVVLNAINLCRVELDNEFESKTEVTVCNLDEYKLQLKELYVRKREWLKSEYLPNEKKAILDFHKLSAIMCRCIIGYKPFSYKIRCAKKLFNKIYKDELLDQDEKMIWQVNNVYINYKLAFLVAEGINFIDLLFWAQCKIDNIVEKYSKQDIDDNIDNVNIKLNVYKNFVNILNNERKRLYSYKTSKSHDGFVTSSVIALMKNDYLKRDFDYLQFAISMFQWQEYTKKQHLYEILITNNLDIQLSELV